VIAIPQERFGIALVAEVIAIDALHVNGRASQVPGMDELTHVSRHRLELCLMTDGNLTAGCLGDANQLLSLLAIDGKGFLYIQVTMRLKALLCHGIMTLRRGRDVNNVGPAGCQEGTKIRETILDAEALSQLPCHKLFVIAYTHDFAVPDPQDLTAVFIGNLPAPNDANAYQWTPSQVLINPKYRWVASSKGTLGLQPVRSLSLRFEYRCPCQ